MLDLPQQLRAIRTALVAATLVACAVTSPTLRRAATTPTLAIRATPALLSTPILPDTLYAYSDARSPLPRSFARGGPGGRGRGGPPPPPEGRGQRGGPGGRGGPVTATDRTPASNAISDAGATLGRVLFYDVRLSANSTTSCGSCHQQQFGFGDTARFSVGLNGGRTNRHSMALANARFYASGRYFWDERAATLEEQVLQPIQNEVEMGMSLDTLVPRLKSTDYYPALFTAAFGSPDVTTDRVARALAQFVRSLVSGNSRFDRAFAGNGSPNFSVLTPIEREGERIFNGRGNCQSCHGTNAQVMDAPRNNGLDARITDAGAGGGRFKAPSLRNVAVRAPYMHDGRFQTLREVVDFYDHQVQPSRTLDPRMFGGGPGRGGRGADGFGPPQGRRLNLSARERDALVAYLESLTDTTFLNDVRFSNPFVGSPQLK